MLTEFKSEYSHYFIDKWDRLQGEHKIWHGNGILASISIFVDHLQQGEYKEWHKNGQLAVQCYFVNDFRHGEYKSWYSNGKEHQSCFYVKGTQHGEFKWVSNDGYKLLNCFYVNGHRVPFKEIPRPQTPEELMMFKLKYDLQLLSTEGIC